MSNKKTISLTRKVKDKFDRIHNRINTIYDNKLSQSDALDKLIDIAMTPEESIGTLLKAKLEEIR